MTPIDKIKIVANMMSNTDQHISEDLLREAIQEIENTSNMPNIYTILDEIKFESLCKKAYLHINNSEFNAQQFIFSIIQKFYDMILNKINTINHKGE